MIPTLKNDVWLAHDHAHREPCRAGHRLVVFLAQHFPYPGLPCRIWGANSELKGREGSTTTGCLGPKIWKVTPHATWQFVSNQQCRSCRAIPFRRIYPREIFTKICKMHTQGLISHHCL